MINRYVNVKMNKNKVNSLFKGIREILAKEKKNSTYYHISIDCTFWLL
jgi:hypothetical protein